MTNITNAILKRIKFDNSKQLMFVSFLLSILVFSTKLQAQEKTSSFFIFQNFQKDTVYKLEIEKGGKSEEVLNLGEIKSRTNIEIRVLSETRGSKECAWKYGSTEIVGFSKNQEEYNDFEKRNYNILNIYQGLEIKFILDSLGRMEKITNFEDCKRFIESAFTTVLNNGAVKPTPDIIEKTRNALKPSYETQEVFLSTYCSEITSYFAIAGQTYSLDSVYTYLSDVPTMLSAINIPITLVTRIDSLKNGLLYISMNQTTDKEVFNKTFKKFYSQPAKEAGRPIKESDFPDFNSSALLTYKYDTLKKIVTEFYAEKTTQTDGSYKILVFTVRLKK